MDRKGRRTACSLSQGFDRLTSALSLCLCRLAGSPLWQCRTSSSLGMYHLLGTGHKSVDEGVKEAIALWEETLEVHQVKGSLRSRAEDSFERPYE